MEKHGVPGTDARDLPTSTKRFPDGAWYRMEISGIERLNVLEAAIDEMNKRNIPLHRMISMVMGVTYFTKQDWKDFAQMAADAKLAVIGTPSPRATWYTGRQIVTPEGGLSGLRVRGSDSLSYAIDEILALIDVGFRGFLAGWAREKVKYASIIHEIVQENFPEGILSEVGAEDLAIPKP
jgi:hypothetical protein